MSVFELLRRNDIPQYPTNRLCRGFLLARLTAGAIGVAIVAIVILVGTFVMNCLGEKRRRAKAVGFGSLQSSDTALVNISHPYDRQDDFGDGRG
jgi:hypothetical protein